MSNRRGLKAGEALVLLLIVMVPLFFWRGSVDTFDLPKATVLWVVTPFFLPVLWDSFRRTDRDRRRLVVVLGVFAAAVVLSAVTSMRPWVSVFGQYQRNTGLLTLLSCVVVTGMIALTFDWRQTARAAKALAWVGVLSSSYVVLQALDLDPWSWTAAGQNRPLFGTIGNINTSAGFLSMVTPLCCFFALSGRGLSRLFWFVSVGVLSASIGLNSSFQGNVALIASSFVLIASGLKSRTRENSVAALLLAAELPFIALFVKEPRGLFTAVVIVVATGFVASRLKTDETTSLLDRLRSSPVTRRASAFGVIVLVAVGTVALWGRIYAEISQGFTERTAFYQSALTNWSRHPLVGSGLETFSYVYTKYRPEWHAVRLEENYVSSAHSVPLGMLTNGGMVLALAYILIVVVVFRIGLSKLAKTGIADLKLFLLGSWLACTLQALVSVEHVALFFTTFVVGGLLIAASLPEPRKSRDSARSTVRMGRFSFAAGSVLALGFLPFLSKPFRAELHAMNGLKSVYNVPDLPRALKEISRASEIAFWEPQQFIRLVGVYNALGDQASIARESNQLVELFDYNPAVGIQSAFAVGQTGDFSRAAEIARRTQANDPLAPKLKAQTANLYVQLAQNMANFGNTEASRSFLSMATELIPDFPPAIALQSSLDQGLSEE